MQNLLASGSLTQQGYRVSVAESPEAQNDITGIVEQVLSRYPVGGDFSWAQVQFIGGCTQAQLRSGYAYGSEAQGDLDTLYQRELNRDPSASELAADQASLNSGVGTQGKIRVMIADSAEAANDINNVFLQVLNRPANANDLAAWQGAFGTGYQDLLSLQKQAAYSTEAQSDLNHWYQVVLGRPIDAAGLATFQALLAGGTNQAQVRSDLAYSGEAAGDIDAYWVAEAGFHAGAADISYWQGEFATAYGLSDLRGALADWGPTVAAIRTIHQQILNRPAQPADIAWAEGLLALPGGNQGQFKANWAEGAEAQADINGLYESVLGRPADPTGLAAEEAALIAGQTQAQIRGALAYSAEAAGDVSTLYGSLFGRAPSSDEAAGFQAAVATGFTGNPIFTISGAVNGAGQIFASSNASTDLAELAVYVTSNSGVTPTVTDPAGGVTTFADATELAAYLLGQAFQAGAANPVLLSTYNLTVSWLAQVDQPLLQAGEFELQAARAAQASGNAGLAQADEVSAQTQLDAAALPAGQRGSAVLSAATTYAQAAQNAVAANIPVWAAFDETAVRVNLAVATTPTPDPGASRLLTAAQQFVTQGQVGVAAGNMNLVTLCNAGADLCLQEIAEPAGARVLGVERIYQSGDVTLDVAVDPNASDPYGSATFHSKDQDGGVTGFLEPLLTAVLDLAAVISGNDWLLAIAAVVNTGEAAQNFSEGNALAGVLDLGSAAGFGAEAVSAFAQVAGVSAGATGTTVAGTPTFLGGSLGATQIVGQRILEATALVGGLSGIVGSAENGDGVGIVAASLETAAAVASGLVTTGSSAGDNQLLAQLATDLGVAGGVTAGADAIEHGHVADGLLAGLGPLFAVIAQSASTSTTAQSDSNDAVTPDGDNPDELGNSSGFGKGPVPSQYSSDVSPDGYIGVSKQCVALVERIAGLGRDATWLAGGFLTPDTVAEVLPGTPVATFNSQGVYTNSLDGSSHAAIFLYGSTQNGQSGIEVLDQWYGQPAETRFIAFGNPGNAANNASAYRIIVK